MMNDEPEQVEIDRAIDDHLDRQRPCPGGPDWECRSPAADGDRYCPTCREAIGA
jgi:hypothetical protein